MAYSRRDEIEAARKLGELVERLGLSHIVYLLADIADEQHDVALGVRDVARATKWAHDGKVLGTAAMALFE